MNKAQLIDQIAGDTGISKKKACAVIDCLTDRIVESLVTGRKINMSGLGIFSVFNRAGRNGRNPQTGGIIMIKGKKRVKFRVGPELSDQLNDNLYLSDLFSH